MILLNKLEFNSKEDRKRYLILRRKTRKVFPYAKLASERLTTMTERLKTIEKKSERKRYTKRVQKYIEEEFGVFNVFAFQDLLPKSGERVVGNITNN